MSSTEKWIVVSKDKDFFDSFILKGEPYKLIIVKLGNTSTKKLKQVFEDQFDEIIKTLQSEDLVMLNRTNLGIKF